MKLQKGLALLVIVAVLSTSGLVIAKSTHSKKLTARVTDALVSNDSVNGFTLIDTDTDVEVGPLEDGAVINLAGGKKYTIRAETEPDKIGSVLFQIDGKNRSDSKKPYAISRDDGHNNFYPTRLTLGEHTLVATPFTGPRVTGLDGISHTVNFTVVDDDTDRSPDNATNNLKVFLGGPYVEATSKMSTGLNDANVIPLSEPYTALGYTLTSGSGAAISSSLLDVTGDDAIVDWILVELRSSTNSSQIIASKPALVEADGDVMWTDGNTPILGTFAPGTYYVAVHHRNHLAVMTNNPMNIAQAVDMSTEPLYGVNAAKTVGGKHVLWPGDINADNQIKYTGSGNDRDVILTSVGGSTPNNQVFNTYSSADVTMDGKIKYTGSGNDRDPILLSVGSTTPSNTLFEQLPVGTVANTFYASPTGTGNGSSAATPFKISNFWPLATPGSTLILLDGVYTGANSMIDPPDSLSGTSGSPITVKAMNDGAVRINGEGARAPIVLYNNNWFVIEGVNAHNSVSSVVSVSYSNNNIIRRVIGWDIGNTGDHNVFGAHHSNTTLFEDVAGFGSGGARKIFSNSQEGNNTTFRRAFGIWDKSVLSGPKKTFALSYNSYNALCENCIGTWNSEMPESYNLMEYNGTQVSPTQSFTNYQVQQPSGIFGHDGFDQTFLNQGNSDNANIRIFGSIAYLKPTQRFHNVPSPSRDWAGPFALEIKGVQLKDSVGIIEPGSHTNIKNPYLGDVGGAGWNSATNSTFISTGGSSINSQWTTSGNYMSSSCANIIANGGNVVNHLGNITGGATIMKRYVDGVLTNDNLWPWPMNQRIIDAMTFAGTTPVDVTATINSLCGATGSSGMSESEIVTLAQQWLAASPAARPALEPNLSSWTANIDNVIDQVQPHNYTAQPTGEVFNQQFTLPALVSKYPGWNDPATTATENYKPEYNMVVPPNYNPNTPVGLMFFLHWGGSFDPIELDYPTTTDPNDSYLTEWVLDDESLTGRSVIRRNVDGSNYIAVAPIAPFGTMLPGYQTNVNMFTHPARWDVPSADEYLMDIITEIASRYNIDYNKVVVTGTSMGGIGAYHMAHRLNDRLSAVMANGGGWSLGSWSSLTDLPILTIHGTNDAYYTAPGSCRNHMTAVEFARRAHQLMGSNNPNDSLVEYPQIPGHGFDTSTTATEPGAMAWKNFLNGQQGTVNSYSRNPYRNHVIAINPWRTYNVGGNWNATWNEDPSPNTMWLSINSYGAGTIPYDRVTPQGDGGCSSQSAWNNWSLAADTVNLAGGKAEATITSGNNINITTSNVTNLSVWLHPNMVNFAQPINLNINGNSIQRLCTSSLLTALKSYERRKDWNMIYTCELPININSAGVPL